MVIDLVVPERLLDHEQVELIELAQVLDLVERVGGVRVATEGDIGPARADPFQNIQIPARFDLDLDAAISRRNFSLNLSSNCSIES